MKRRCLHHGRQVDGWKGEGEGKSKSGRRGEGGAGVRASIGARNNECSGLDCGRRRSDSVVHNKFTPSLPLCFSAVFPVTQVFQGLAKAIAWDGEGATCLIEVGHVLFGCMMQ